MGISIALLPSVFAADSVNTVNDGRIVPGGTYYNTADSKTTFINSGHGGLWVQNNNTVRGLEVDAGGQLTNNGGTLHFFAPGSVVRVDGNIDVSGIVKGGTTYLGNGGKVFIDSAYLFQSGNIFANGINGGLVQANVGAMTLATGARIEARGFGGEGGIVSINASGPVDIQQAALIDTSGKVIGTFDTNLVNIEAGMVNNEGLIKADGVNSRGGTVRLVASGQSDLSPVVAAFNDAGKFNPGEDESNTAPPFTDFEIDVGLVRMNQLVEQHDGDVRVAVDPSGLNRFQPPLRISANGDYGSANASRPGGSGGTIMLSAVDDVINEGRLTARGGIGGNSAQPSDGGQGGTIAMAAGQDVINRGRIEANGGRGGNPQNDPPASGGTGGDGGLIAVSYDHAFINTGFLYASGGQGGSSPHAAQAGPGGDGGLIVLSGDENPVGGGNMDANGGFGGNPGSTESLERGGQAGTIVVPEPDTLSLTQVAFQRGFEGGGIVLRPITEQTRTVELLTHNENLLMLISNSDVGIATHNLFDLMDVAWIRSVEDPTGLLGLARAEVIDKNSPDGAEPYRNLLVANTRDGVNLDLTQPYFLEPGAPEPDLNVPHPLSRGKSFTGLNTFTLVTNGPVTTNNLPSPIVDAPTFSDFWILGRNHDIQGGGRISVLADGNFTNVNQFGTRGVWSGGSLNIASGGTLSNGNGDVRGDLLTNAPGPFSTSLTGPAFHGGSILLKAGQDILNNNNIFFQRSDIRSDGQIIGGTQRLVAGRDILNLQNSSSGGLIRANGSLQGGVITGHAGRNFFNSMLPDGTSVQGEEQAVIRANGTDPALGRGGYIRLMADDNFKNEGIIEAKGGLEDGTVITSGGNP